MGCICNSPLSSTLIQTICASPLFSSWNWAYTSFLIFPFSQAHLITASQSKSRMASEIGYHVLNTTLGLDLTPLLFPDLIWSSSLFPARFPQAPTDYLPTALLTPNKHFLPDDFWQLRKLRHQNWPKGTSLHRGRWSPQYSSSQEQNQMGCTSSEKIIERRALGESQG